MALSAELNVELKSYIPNHVKTAATQAQIKQYLAKSNRAKLREVIKSSKWNILKGPLADLIEPNLTKVQKYQPKLGRVPDWYKSEGSSDENVHVEQDYLKLKEALELLMKQAAKPGGVFLN
jgi:hypothetical protein